MKSVVVLTGYLFVISQDNSNPHAIFRPSLDEIRALPKLFYTVLFFLFVVIVMGHSIAGIRMPYSRHIGHSRSADSALQNTQGRTIIKPFGNH
jgi:succinate dehydrogenase hydrophobic anchor subunit